MHDREINITGKLTDKLGGMGAKIVRVHFGEIPTKMGMAVGSATQMLGGKVSG